MVCWLNCWRKYVDPVAILTDKEDLEMDNLNKIALNADLVHHPDLEDMIELPEDQ